MDVIKNILMTVFAMIVFVVSALIFFALLYGILALVFYLFLFVLPSRVGLTVIVAVVVILFGSLFRDMYKTIKKYNSEH